MAQSRLLRPRNVAIAATAAVILLVVGAIVFKPWLLFTNVRVDEQLSSATESSAPVPSPAVSSGAPTSTPTAPAVPVVIAAGEFISHEHETSGSARIVENPDGTRVLELENLATSNGPDLRVWLSESAVVPGADGWFVAGGSPYIELGPLKGNQGNQVYEIPADANLDAIKSVAIWCVQFSVSFGAASLAG